ncbi:putative permease [secondary endosymbiont of Heteropsylla cubana]|uniref:Lipopolysaccharide export system permease protein LptF n=1 Tax=secondary endosymbiont of Heteropsylla cubana TaxID=134287 RepID=J3TYN7_9ENTR|nr:LPS export ABC transporter permease LptF [secondary endosymbiont of Heteropsylla cubana]AFP85525.1 putative permease [secondary endosymbiont of Heteropsylla cubana]
MIITRYLVRETFKNQLAILLILLFVFFCQKLVRVLSATVNGEIPIKLVLSFLALGMPAIAQIILPLSLFLGLLITLRRMHIEAEIMIMYACGLGKILLIRATLILSLITMFFASINVIWLLPWSSRNHDLMMAESAANPRMVMMLDKQFKSIANGKVILFVQKVKNYELQHIFLAQIKPYGKVRPFFLIADRGYLTQKSDGSQLITLKQGVRYEGSALSGDFCINTFFQYQSVIDCKSIKIGRVDAEHMSLCQLWHSTGLNVSSEFHWRLTLVVSVLILAMMAVSFSIINPREKQILSVVPAMLLYLVFFLLQTLFRAKGAKGKLDPMMWMWIINTIYLLLGVAFNLWDSLFIRKFRQRF